MPVLSVKHVPSYDLSIDGAPVEQQIADRVREVRVISSLASPDLCTLRVLFDKPRRAGDKHPIDDNPFDIGKRIEVKIGEREAQRPTTLFKGDIVTLEPDFGASGVELLVRAFDVAHKLFRARRVRTFSNQTVSDIVSKVCGEASIPVTCDASGEPLEYMQQVNETDWDFISRLGDRIGFEFVLLQGQAAFRKPTGAGTVELRYPDQLFSFRPRVTAIQQVDRVSVRAFDPKTKDVLEASAESPELLAGVGLTRDEARETFQGDEVLVATEPVASQGQAAQVAQALLDRLGNGYVTAEGTTPGNPAVRAGTVVAIKGVGTTFEGTYRVHTATHTLRGGGVYETHFTNAPGFTIAGALGGGTAAGSGAAGAAYTAHPVIGVVTNNNDPMAFGRVTVKLPALGDDAESGWARVVVASAGEERGLMMLPVVGEEVLVCFEHGDVTRPYVIGSLFNGRDLPGDELADQKGSFALRSDEKVTARAKKQMALTTEDELEITAAKNAKVHSDQSTDRRRAAEPRAQGRDAGHDLDRRLAAEDLRRRRCSSQRREHRALGHRTSGRAAPDRARIG